MARYVTTNLRFPEETYRELQYQARGRGVPLAFLGPIAFGEDAADHLVGSVDGSAGDESVDHDHYLYGWPKEGSRDARPGARRRSTRRRDRA